MTKQYPAPGFIDRLNKVCQVQTIQVVIGGASILVTLIAL